MKIKKPNFRAVICVCLVILTVISLTSCGTKKMPIDKYEQAVNDVSSQEDMSYDTKSIDYRNKKEAEWQQSYDLDSEIDRMFIIKNSAGEEQACVVKFYKEAQAKKFVRKYKAERGINFSAKVDRVISLIKGEYDGKLLEIFEFDLACERDGDIVIYGNSELVKAVIDTK